MESTPGYYKIKRILQEEEKGIYPDLEAIQGGFETNRSALLLPADKPVRLREREGKIDLRGIGRKDLNRNSLIIPDDWGGAWTREAIFYSAEKNFFQGRTSLTEPLLSSIQPRSTEGRIKQQDHMVLMQFFHPLFLIPGMEYQTEKGRSILLFHEELPASKRDFIQKALSDWKNQQDLYRQTLALRLALLKWTSLPRERMDIHLQGALNKGSILVNQEYWDKEKKILVKELSSMGGKKEREISPRYSAMLRPLLEEAMEEGIIQRRRGYLQRGDRDPQKGLSPFAAHCLEKLNQTPGGLSPLKVPPGEKTQYLLMERMGLLRMSDQWICSEKDFQENREELKKLLSQMGETDIGPLKEASSLSRRELLHTLQWMEEEGEVLNQNNRRRLADS